MLKKNKKNGFTLIELLVVIAVISLLSSVIFASLNKARKKARDAKRISDMHQLSNALALYVDDIKNIPLSNNCGNTRTGAIHGACVTNTNSPNNWYIGDKMVSSGYLKSNIFDPLYPYKECHYVYYTNSAGTHFQFSTKLENPPAELPSQWQPLPGDSTACVSSLNNNYRIIGSF
jgi:prepilin-type N-terminal cleavage/methylation domain-containing protein